MCARERRTSEVSICEVGIDKYGVSEICASEVGISEMSVGETTAAEIHVCQRELPLGSDQPSLMKLTMDVRAR